MGGKGFVGGETFGIRSVVGRSTEAERVSLRQSPNMKFPLDPALEEGREETEIARYLSGSQAKRSDREGHDASISGYS